MDIEKQISNAVNNIYEAALKPEQWEQALCSLSGVISCYAADLYFWDMAKNQPIEVYTTKFIDQKAQQEYLEYYSKKDRRVSYLIDNPDVSEYYDDQFMTYEERQREEYFDWEWKATEQKYCFGVRLSQINDVSCVISFGKSDKPEHPEREEIYLLNRMVPHLKQAIRLTQNIQCKSFERDVLFETSDLNLRAIYILDQNGEVLYLNKSAKELLIKSTVLILNGRELYLTNGEYRKYFNETITNILTRNFHKGCSGGRFSIFYKGGQLPLQCLISPLPAFKADRGGKKPTIMISITDPSNISPSLTPQLFNNLYNFTKREAELAVYLISGDDKYTAAARMKISNHTIQVYLKSMFHKTGTNSQAGLISILMKS